MANTILNSFTLELFNSLPEIEETESYRWRFSKKRKFDEISYIIDDHMIISDTDDDDDDIYNDDDLVDDYIANDFRVWRRNYIKKYKCIS
jgi:hypothetical protein